MAPNSHYKNEHTSTCKLLPTNYNLEIRVWSEESQHRRSWELVSKADGPTTDLFEAGHALIWCSENVVSYSTVLEKGRLPFLPWGNPARADIPVLAKDQKILRLKRLSTYSPDQHLIPLYCTSMVPEGKMQLQNPIWKINQFFSEALFYK